MSATAPSPGGLRSTAYVKKALEIAGKHGPVPGHAPPSISPSGNDTSGGPFRSSERYKELAKELAQKHEPVLGGGDVDGDSDEKEQEDGDDPSWQWSGSAPIDGGVEDEAHAGFAGVGQAVGRKKRNSNYKKRHERDIQTWGQQSGSIALGWTMGEACSTNTSLLCAYPNCTVTAPTCRCRTCGGGIPVYMCKEHSALLHKCDGFQHHHWEEYKVAQLGPAGVEGGVWAVWEDPNIQVAELNCLLGHRNSCVHAPGRPRHTINQRGHARQAQVHARPPLYPHH